MSLLEMAIYNVYVAFVILLTMVRSLHADEAVHLTVLAKSHMYMDNGERLPMDNGERLPEYQCYVTEANLSVQHDVNMTSSRTVWTRDTLAENPEPPDAEYYIDRWPRYKVQWDDIHENNVFGVFSCTASINGKEDATVPHTRMRADADIVPTNGLFSQTFNINDTGVSIYMTKTNGSCSNVSMFRWNKDNVSISSADGSSKYTISGKITVDDAGVYECYMDGERNLAKQALQLVIVRACPAARWDPPDCLKVCNSCYNGGICNENTGKCVCAPGFRGTYCDYACGGNRFGYTCEYRCTRNKRPGACGKNLFCLNHPFGCRCITGFKGLDCTKECSEGTFGASCLQTCHCTTNQCNRYTGKCINSTCTNGWTGANCQECADDFFGPNCTEQCHCKKELCNSETGLCKPGGCLEQWVDLFPPFSCQTGLTSISISPKQNPGVDGWIACVAVEGPGGDLDDFDLVISRNRTILDTTGIVKQSISKEGSTRVRRATVSTIFTGDEFYCQLRQNDRRLALLPIIAETFELPWLGSSVEIVSVTVTSVTISWSQWKTGKDIGDGPVVGYTLYYRREAESIWSQAAYLTADEPNEYVVTDLEADTNYFVSVAAVREGDLGEGLKSPPRNVTTSSKETPTLFDVAVYVGGFLSFVLLLLLIRIGRKCWRNHRSNVMVQNMPLGESLGDEMQVRSVSCGDVQRPPPIHVNDFRSYVTNSQTGHVDKMREQFMLLEQVQVQWKSDVGGKIENMQKNRFANMPPYDHSRVVLELQSGDPHSDYYNANYIKDLSGNRRFIACQAPNKSSVNDFWRMIWQENVVNIVMLTDLIERGKDRCLQYWPKAEKEQRYFGEINVLWSTSDVSADHCLRTLRMTLGNATRNVVIYHFLSWPVMNIPNQPTQLLTLVKKVKSAQRNIASPLVVHCSGGIGRTGTFIALYNLLDQIHEAGVIDVFGYVERMREDRIHMIQTATQYAFLHECLLEEYLSGETWIVKKDMAELSIHEEMGKLKDQIQILSELDERDNNPLCQKGTDVKSVGKTSHGYIHAFTVNSYRRSDAFILIQSPLSVEDLWKLVLDYNCHIIVMLDQLETYPLSWFLTDCNLPDYGHIKLLQVAIEERVSYTYRHIKARVGSNRRDELRYLQINSWDENNLRDIWSVAREVNRLQDMYSLGSPTLVHCIDSVSRSGILLCLNSEMERVKAEGRFDVFNTVRKLRASNRHFVESEEDYVVCHQLLKLHIASASDENIYENQ